jgi:hypothetical protein
LEWKATEDVKRAKINAIVPWLDISTIKSTLGTCVELDLQLEWHRQQDSCVLMKNKVTEKQEKINALKDAGKCYNSGQQVNNSPMHNIDMSINVLSDSDEEDEDWE